MRFFNANANDLVSLDAATGWLGGGAGVKRWTLCTAADTTPPCSHAPLEAISRADAFVRENVYYYDFNSSDQILQGAADPVIDEWAGGDDYSVQALLCVVDFDIDAYVEADQSTWAKCDTSGTLTNNYLAIKLISTGIADDGTGESIVEKMIGSVQPGGGAPGVPLSVTSNTQSTGTVSIVTNPHGGGHNVPVSVWSKNDVDMTSLANSSTCHFEEYLQSRDSAFWRTITMSDGDVLTVCDSCTCPDTIEEGALSYTNTGQGAREYIDIVDNDPNYPDDLFLYYFGYPRSEWKEIRKTAETVDDCSGLDANSKGFIWADSYCDLPANTEIGSAENPVILMTPDGIKLNANTVYYGVLLILDPEVPPDQQTAGSLPVTLNGGPIIYGSIMTDPGGNPFNGGYTLVYVDNILTRIVRSTVLGTFPGSWSDLAQSN
jgi:hypothetical protein